MWLPRCLSRPRQHLRWWEVQRQRCGRNTRLWWEPCTATSRKSESLFKVQGFAEKVVSRQKQYVQGLQEGLLKSSMDVFQIRSPKVNISGWTNSSVFCAPIICLTCPFDYLDACSNFIPAVNAWQTWSVFASTSAPAPRRSSTIEEWP